jgi:hypothetical protein
VLERLGWLEFCDGNVDELQYRDWDAIASDKGPLWGLSMDVDGRRLAYIATGHRSALSVASTIVHESAHLQGLREIGQAYDERYARMIEHRFLDSAQALHEGGQHP